MIKKTARSIIDWLNPGKALKITSKQIDQVDKEALQILERLRKGGHESYLVGGCVRDLLLGKRPKDFDIATRASPQQVKNIIHRSFIIGRRFRIVVAKRRPDPVSTALKNHPFLSHAPRAKEKEFQITTFRRAPDVQDGQINENVFGEPIDDAQRRDFTINGLFLDVQNHKVVDFVGGLPDLKNKMLRMIGDPELRFIEDPIRILRALRFLHRAKLKWESKTFEALKKHASSLGDSKKERIREEVLKMIREGTGYEVFKDMDHLHLWPHVSQDLAKLYQHTSARRIQNDLIQAAAKFPWPDELDTVPLFFLILLPAFVTHGDALPSRIPQDLEALFNDLKISKKEREGLERILSTLGKIKRDPQGRHPEKLFIKNHKIFENLNRSFYVLKLYSITSQSTYSKIFTAWEKAWKSYSEQMKKVPHHRHQSRHAHPHHRRPAHPPKGPATST